MDLNHGIIGNCKTAALISREGSIDWCCFPDFDSPSIFARLLDNEKGGSFYLEPVGKYKIKQKYRKHTNILETTFTSKKASFRITDFFIKSKDEKSKIKQNAIYRYIKVLKGSPKVRVIFNPALDYAREKTILKNNPKGIIAENKKHKIYLHTNLNHDEIIEKKEIQIPKESYFILSYKKPCSHSLRKVKTGLENTDKYWNKFVDKSTWPKFHKEQVIRSALTLKLLTYEDSGAVIAAPTTSLPEVTGKERNWDYRYCWLRDSSFTIDSLTRICHFDEAKDYMGYLKKVTKKKKSKRDLQIMFDVRGENNLEEKKLNHLKGYKNSKPVRIGNAAYKQKQIDVAGEIIHTLYRVYVVYKYYKKIDKETWELIVNLVNYVKREWRTKDSTIWEFRDKIRHYTFSKLLSWVALDKAIQIAKEFNKNGHVEEWKHEKNLIRDKIIKEAYDEKKKTFTMYYGSNNVDASLLLMTYFEFFNAEDKMFKKTLSKIKKDLQHGCLVKRYNIEDDFGKSNTAFTICSFWLIDALYLCGQKSEAKKLFKTMMSHSNHLGLFSEGIDLKTREQRGNFPQAYTHVAMINTAILLSGRKHEMTCKTHLEEYLKDKNGKKSKNKTTKKSATKTS